MGGALTLRVNARTQRANDPGIELGLLRSDYMVDAPSGAPLQVEINTIAASFACLSALTGASTLFVARLQLQSTIGESHVRTRRPHASSRRAAHRLAAAVPAFGVAE